MFQGVGTWITKDGTKKSVHQGYKDACYFSQIIIEPLRTVWGNSIRKVLRKVENLVEEQCNKRENFVGKPLFQRC